MRALAKIFHALGLSSLGGAVFLQILVFSNIAMQGYFFGVEPNKLILTLEFGLTGFAVFYFLSLCKEKLERKH